MANDDHITGGFVDTVDPDLAKYPPDYNASNYSVQPPYARPQALPDARWAIGALAANDAYKPAGEGAFLPDVGAPAIPSGGQFSSGVPAVNAHLQMMYDKDRATLGAVGSGAMGALADLATLPKRAYGAAQSYADTGVYDPAPAVETALTLAGGAPLTAEKNAAGVFGGRLARTADLDALARAEKMAAEGRFTDDIWTETGWHQGADKQWRFEIPDQNSKWIDNPQQFTGMSPQGTTPHASGSLPMGSVFDHPELYKAYPQLAGTDLNLGYLGQNVKGSFQRGSDVGDPATITVGRSMGRNPLEDMRSTNLHELQHNIQDIEGFATGGNTFSLKPGTPAWGIYQERLKAIRTPTPEAELTKAGVLGPDYTYADYLREHKQTLKNDKLGLDRAAQEYAVGEGYKRLAGEVEARNVQKRADWDLQKLRDIPPGYSQDYANTEQFVKYRDPVSSLAEPQMSIEKPQGIRAYHSSPHDFDRFDLSKIGTGEGAQMYGHGLYFAENPAVSGQGGQYWNQFMRHPSLSEAQQHAGGRLAAEGFDKERAIAATQRDVNDWLDIMKPNDYAAELRGTANSFSDKMHAKKMLELRQAELDALMSGKAGPRTYEVNINADPAHMLDWDKPLREQSQKVQDVYRQVFPSGQTSWGYTPEAGENLYRSLAAERAHGRPVAKDVVGASAQLNEAGIPGIKYLDEGSRALPGGQILGTQQTPQGWVSNIRGAHPSSFNGGAMFTRSMPFPTEAEALAWASDKTKTKPTSNYVIFDPSKIDILKKYGIAGAAPVGLGALAAQGNYQPEERQ